MLKAEQTPSKTPLKVAHDKILKRLAEENRELRGQLRALNSQLDGVLETAAERPKPLQDTAAEELKGLLKVLPTYEAHHEKLTARVSQLSDPNYRVTLERSVIEQESRVRELETTIANLKKYRRQREKVLESVLETGITQEMANQLSDLQAGIVVTARKVAEVERRSTQIAETFTRLSEKEKESMEKLAEEESRAQFVDPPAAKPPLSANTELEARLKHLDNSLARKKVMVRSLETELKTTQETLAACNLKLTRLTSELELKAVEVQDMSGIYEEKVTHRRVQSNSGRKVFATER